MPAIRPWRKRSAANKLPKIISLPKRSQHHDNTPVAIQTSAGGVAVREINGALHVAIVKMLPEMRWQLPKGIIDPGETPEIAALREVNEEAGVTCELIESIERIEYWFSADRDGVWTRIHKFVHPRTAEKDVAHDQQRPSIADHIEGARQWTI